MVTIVLTFSGRREVRLDCLQQISRPAVMEEEQPLANAPKGRRAKHVAGGSALLDVVSQTRAHVMD